MVRLETGMNQWIPFVNESAIDSTSSTFAYSTVDTLASENGFFAMDLTVDEPQPEKILGTENAYYTNLTWDHKRSRIALNAAVLDSTRDYQPKDASIITWTAFEGEPETMLMPDDVEDGYRLRSNNNLVWTYDGRVFFTA